MKETLQQGKGERMGDLSRNFPGMIFFVFILIELV